MSYKAHFKGGPSHGEVTAMSKAEQIIYVTKVYDMSGFRTKSKYNLIDQKGEDLYYILDEERFDGINPTPFKKH
jgi:hypothetical protein